MLMDLPQRLFLRGAHGRGMAALGAHFFPLFKAGGEFRHTPLVQDPDPRREGAQQGAVVAHQDDRAVVCLDRVLERFDRFHVEMIRRLVEHQEIRA